MSSIPKVKLVIEASRSYGRGLLRGIARYAHTYGPWSIYREGPDYLFREQELLRASSWLDDEAVDGIIMREQDIPQTILDRNVPLIIIRRSDQLPDGMNIIDTDSVASGQMAAEHFMTRGFRHFAFCGYSSMYWSRLRGESYEQELNKAGYRVHFYNEPETKEQLSWDKEQIFLKNWLESLPKPVGLFVCNDDRGQHVIEACKQTDFTLPDEISILGVDNDEMICELTTPPMSSVVINSERAGYIAAELLDRMMQGEKITGQTILARPTHIASRLSTDILAIEDVDINKAVHYIRQNARNPIQVHDVLKVVNMSRCGLYKKFRKVLGRSVHDEIKRVRIELITHLLINTDTSISQIAQEMGYANENHIARYFRQEKGMNPLAYRKKYSNRL